VDYFNQSPTNEELNYRKLNRWLFLKNRKMTFEKVLDACENLKINIGRNNCKSTPTNVAQHGVVKSSFTSNTIDSNTSANSSNDSYICISKSEEE